MAGCPGAEDDAAGVRAAAIAATAVIYLQLLLGALMRHLDAGLAIPDFPLAFGGWCRRSATRGWSCTSSTAWARLRCSSRPARAVYCAHRSGDVRFIRPAGLLALLVLVQIASGPA